MRLKEAKRILMFLERREVYLLERFIQGSRRGKGEEIVEEMEWEAKDRTERKKGRKIAKNSIVPGLILTLIFILLISIFSVEKPSKSVIAVATGGGGGGGKILISYFFNAEYLELTGYKWDFARRDLLARIKFATFYISFGGNKRKKAEKILKDVLYETDNWKVRSRVFYLLAKIAYGNGNKRQALYYVKKSYEEIRYPSSSPLAYDTLTFIMRLLFETGNYDRMEKYVDNALTLLERDFYYPLFKYMAFYLMEKHSGSSYYMSFVVGTVNRMLENFPSNLKLSADFLNVLDKGNGVMFLFVRALVYKSLGYREKTLKTLSLFIKRASLNPAKYSVFILDARRMMNAI